MLAAGAITLAVVVVLGFRTRAWYTPVLEVVGLLAAGALLWLGVRWSLSVLEDEYED